MFPAHAGSAANGSVQCRRLSLEHRQCPVSQLRSVSVHSPHGGGVPPPGQTRSLLTVTLSSMSRSCPHPSNPRSSSVGVRHLPRGRLQVPKEQSAFVVHVPPVPAASVSFTLSGHISVQVDG